MPLPGFARAVPIRMPRELRMPVTSLWVKIAVVLVGDQSGA